MPSGMLRPACASAQSRWMAHRDTLITMPDIPMNQPPRPSASAVDVLIPTNPLAALACWIGIGSVVLCGLGALLGPVAIVLGWLGLKKWKLQESSYGATTSKIRAWIGIVAGALGTVIGVVFLIVLFAKG
jgi:hypothetical protein